MTRITRSWAVVTMAAVLGLAACGSGHGGSGNSAGGARAGNPIGDAAIKAANVVARAQAFQRPLDAAPSPDGSVIYFSGAGDHGPAVFSVAAAGGAVATVAQGAPLVNPTGVAVALDGSRIYVADQQAGGSGAILAVPTAGTARTQTVIGGTQGRGARGLDVVNEAGAEVIYFTGTDPATGMPGLFKVPSAGGAVSAVAEGAPFTVPDSVVVTAQGAAYVSDQGQDVGQGTVFKVSGGTATAVLGSLHLGAPAGVTLINSDATLLVSSIDATLSDQVLFVDLATGNTAAATKVIGANKNSSGGLHRAHNAAVLAWADVSRSGKVYRVEPVA